MSLLKVLFKQRLKLVAAIVILLLFSQLGGRGRKSQTIPNLQAGSGSDTIPNGYPIDVAAIEKDRKKPKIHGFDPEEVVASGKLSADSIIRSIRDYTVFFNNMESYAPGGHSLKDKYKEGGKAKELFSNHDSFLFSKEYLENVLDVSNDMKDRLSNSHKNYVDVQMKKLIEVYGLDTFGNILKTDTEWDDYHGSSGYVLVGGGKYSFLSYLVIRQIRATGAKKPIELFIPSKLEYEKAFCETILPKYNARCNVFDTKLAGNLKKSFNLGGYQYKMLALMSSSFERVMYIDSDNFPTRNMDYLFDSELFNEKGLILWPDAWARTTNPVFYEIAGIKVKENKLRYSTYDKKQAEKEGKPLKPLSEFSFKDSWFHDFEGALPDPTSETGMLLINRTSHLKTLLLALYYNVYGPFYYYPLLTQGSAGEGDKETFIAAATAMQQTYFQTLKQFKWTGYVSQNDNKFTSKALAHYDPIQSQDTSKDDIDIVFMHLSYPKYYPNWLVDNHDLVYRESGDHIRMYESIYENVGYDFDLRVLQFFTQAICPNYYDSQTSKAVDGEDIDMMEEYMGDYLAYVDDDEEHNINRCKDVFIPHLQWLKETTKFKEGSVIV
ncbi:hypothetical protein G9P44_002990 [Scheffersomyces stipitis]|nr:hypothetical protein G9P44_002990 [Scheffersomyces stipitis]